MKLGRLYFYYDWDLKFLFGYTKGVCGCRIFYCLGLETTLFDKRCKCNGCKNYICKCEE